MVWHVLGHYLSSLAHLFFPKTCAVCGEILVEGEHFICTACRWNMPLTNFWVEEDNPVKRKLESVAEIYRASSMFYYQKGSGYENLVYKFKYNGRPAIAYELGRWFGRELVESGLYGDVDIIIPVPLHVVRKMKRGYNQSEYIARGISKELGAKVSNGNLVRRKYNRSQVGHSKWDRWSNVSGIFTVRKPERFEGKHILLIDDVLTTGATIQSCITAIRNRTEECRISVITLATTAQDVFGND